MSEFVGDAGIEIENVSVRLAGRFVLDRITTKLEPGKLICVLGPNGAGKTTLLKAIGGLVPSSGRIRINGTDVAAMPPRERARKIAYLPQGHVAHWPITAREAVAIGRMQHGAEDVQNSVAIAVAMANTGVENLADRPVTELSGGERARVMLARALAVEAPLLLADEPISALDPAHQLAVLGLLQRLTARGTTVVAALHEITLAARFADHVLVLHDGRLAAAGAPSAVLDDALLSRVFRIEAARLNHAEKTLLVPWLPQADLHR